MNKNDGGRFPQELLFKILDASSFKLNWVLDPFMGFGDVGVACKNNGRRFIGFETNKDYLLLAMKGLIIVKWIIWRQLKLICMQP